MHVADAGNGAGCKVIQFRCSKCGYDTGWIRDDLTVTENRRGLPCPKCNELEAVRPLFVPLKREHFDAFERGDKDHEYRAYGPRWNEATCRVGRRVLLSFGYGKQRRLRGVIVGFAVVGADADPAIRTVYPIGEKFAAIKIKLSSI
jgi:hypothetical protein